MVTDNDNQGAPEGIRYGDLPHQVMSYTYAEAMLRKLFKYYRKWFGDLHRDVWLEEPGAEQRATRRRG